MSERILVYGLFADKLTGQDTFLLNMNEHMSSGCIFDYVVMGTSCIHEDRIKQKGGCIYFIRNYWKSPIGYICDVIHVYRSARKKYSVAYFNLFSMVHDIPIIVSKILGYRVILHSHNSSIPKLHLLHYLNRSIVNALFQPDLRLACSDIAAQFMFGNNKKYTIICNAIDTSHFRFNDSVRQEIRKELNIEDQFVVGFIGRLEEQKNPVFLIDIMREVIRSNPQSVMIIIGTGHLKTKMKQRAEDYGIFESIMFLGNQNRACDYYSVMDVFVLPSLYEGLPIVTIEAQAEGLPCIISKEGVTKECVIVKEKVRFISLKESPGAWASAILNCKSKKIDRASIYKKIEISRFDIEIESENLERILTTKGKPV